MHFSEKETLYVVCTQTSSVENFLITICDCTFGKKNIVKFYLIKVSVYGIEIGCRPLIGNYIVFA